MSTCYIKTISFLNLEYIYGKEENSCTKMKTLSKMSSLDVVFVIYFK